jgi:hypothetical protein
MRALTHRGEDNNTNSTEGKIKSLIQRGEDENINPQRER